MNLADPEDRTVASAEFVLGTLDAQERAQFLARLAHDEALQAEVGFWQDRLLGLAGQVKPVEPSSAVWERIEASLPATVVAAPSRARPSPAVAPTPTVTFWERIGFWRAFSGVAVAASLLLASLLVLQQAPAPQRQYVAVLQSPDKQAGWLVQVDDASGPVKLVPLVDPGRIPAGMSWQFWTKPKDAAGPTSLGLLPQAGAIEVPRDRLPALGDEQLFEITLEPEGGSPLGRPTGPILFVGKARRV